MWRRRQTAWNRCPHLAVTDHPPSSFSWSRQMQQLRMRRPKSAHSCGPCEASNKGRMIAVWRGGRGIHLVLHVGAVCDMLCQRLRYPRSLCCLLPQLASAPSRGSACPKKNSTISVLHGTQLRVATVRYAGCALKFWIARVQGYKLGVKAALVLSARGVTSREFISTTTLPLARVPPIGRTVPWQWSGPPVEPRASVNAVLRHHDCHLQHSGIRCCGRGNGHFPAQPGPPLQ